VVRKNARSCPSSRKRWQTAASNGLANPRPWYAGARATQCTRPHRRRRMSRQTRPLPCPRFTVRRKQITLPCRQQGVVVAKLRAEQGGGVGGRSLGGQVKARPVRGIAGLIPAQRPARRQFPSRQSVPMRTDHHQTQIGRRRGHAGSQHSVFAIQKQPECFLARRSAPASDSGISIQNTRRSDRRRWEARYTAAAMRSPTSRVP
jgi:hypothetical protein